MKKKQKHVLPFTFSLLKPKHMRHFLISCLCLFVTSFKTNAQTSVKPGQSLSASFDSILAKEFKPNEPGATAIVVRKGQVIYKKAIIKII